jgi:hypothetical protein
MRVAELALKTAFLATAGVVAEADFGNPGIASAAGLATAVALTIGGMRYYDGAVSAHELIEAGHAETLDMLNMRAQLAALPEALPPSADPAQ